MTARDDSWRPAGWPPHREYPSGSVNTISGDAIEAAVAAVLTGYMPDLATAMETPIREDAERAVNAADLLIRADKGERIAQAIEAKADDLDWDGAVATKGELEAVRDYAVTVLHEAAAIARGGESDG